MINSLTLSTLIISLLLTIFCATTAHKNRGKTLLALLFGMIAVQSGFKYLAFTTTFLYKNPVYLIFPEVSAIITPPIIFLFVLAVLNKRPTRNLLLKMSILPVFAVVMFFTFFALTAGFTKDVYYVLENFIILHIVTLASYIIYVVLAYRKISFALKHQQLDVGNHTRVVLFWVKLLLALMLFRALIGIVYFSFQLGFPQATWFASVTDIHKAVITITLLVATILTAYYALRNPYLFESITEKKTLEQSLAMAILPDSEKKAIKKAIDPGEIQNYIDQIESVVKSEKLYLNSNLNAGFLSEKVGLPVYKITLSLNKGLGKNLNDYINSYRVEHAKTLLSDQANARLTIYSIALDSGFASEAPFYAAFKKKVGVSPSAYRAQILGNKEE